MATSALIIEILVSGFFTLTWLTLLMFGIYGVELESLPSLMDSSKDYLSILVLLLLALTYQLGWLMNYISYVFCWFLMVKRMRKNIFQIEANDYEIIKTKVFAKAPSEFIKKITEEHSKIRLSRSGIINFLIIGIALIIYKYYALGLLSFSLVTIAFFHTRETYKIYYIRIFNYHKSFSKK